jgi:hypothetical protein
VAIIQHCAHRHKKRVARNKICRSTDERVPRLILLVAGRFAGRDSCPKEGIEIVKGTVSDIAAHDSIDSTAMIFERHEFSPIETVNFDTLVLPKHSSHGIA